MASGKTLMLQVFKCPTSAEKIERLTSFLPYAQDLVKDRGDFYQLAGNLLAELSEREQDKEIVNKFVTAVLAANFLDVADKSRHETGKFLVETVRLCNFTFHDSGKLAALKELCENVGIPWKGEADKCIKLATFSGLDYMAHNGGYIACAV